jgi:uncharacterized repeat protein (TIGR03803 family)
VPIAPLSKQKYPPRLAKAIGRASAPQRDVFQAQGTGPVSVQKSALHHPTQEEESNMSRPKMVAIDASRRHTGFTARSRLATLYGCIIKTSSSGGREMAKPIILFFMLCATAAIGQSQPKIAQLAAFAGAAPVSFKTLASFDGTDGGLPLGSLAQGLDGNFYGTTAWGGTGDGTFFKITPAGKETVLYDFCSQADCVDGIEPIWNPVLAVNGNFYGMTLTGGLANCVAEAAAGHFLKSPPRVS